MDGALDRYTPMPLVAGSVIIGHLWRLVVANASGKPSQCAAMFNNLINSRPEE